MISIVGNANVHLAGRSAYQHVVCCPMCLNGGGVFMAKQRLGIRASDSSVKLGAEIGTAPSAEVARRLRDFVSPSIAPKLVAHPPETQPVSAAIILTKPAAKSTLIASPRPTNSANVSKTGDRASQQKPLRRGGAAGGTSFGGRSQQHPCSAYSRRGGSQVQHFDRALQLLGRAEDMLRKITRCTSNRALLTWSKIANEKRTDVSCGRSK